MPTQLTFLIARAWSEVIRFEAQVEELKRLAMVERTAGVKIKKETVKNG